MKSVTPSTTSRHVVPNDGIPPPDASLLFERRKILVQQTWRLVEQALSVKATEKFYARLFQRHPDVKLMFHSTNMDAQALKLYELLRVAVRFIDGMDQLVPVLKEMGIRHARAFGVRREHYAATTEILIEVINESLESQLESVVEDSMALWKLDVAAAWSWVLSFIGNTMASAAEEAKVVEEVAKKRSTFMPSSQHHTTSDSALKMALKVSHTPIN